MSEKKDKYRFRIYFTLEKEHRVRFKKIKNKIREDMIKANKISSFKVLNNSECFKEMLNILESHYKIREENIINKLRDIRKNVIVNKIQNRMAYNDFKRKRDDLNASKVY